jgi:hypothetical protein
MVWVLATLMGPSGKITREGENCRRVSEPRLLIFYSVAQRGGLVNASIRRRSRVSGVRVGSTLIGERVLGWEKESDSFSAIRALIFLHFSKENKRKEAKEKKEMVTSNAGGVVLIFRKIHHFRKTHVRVQ